MNYADLPGMAVALPILAIEFWYWGQPFKNRSLIVNRVSAGLLVALVVFLVFRHFTNWGEIRF